MAISKKLRFQIFQRDNFTCQYCGKKPPEVVLEADHVISKKDGGQDDEMNLITSCFACNRGKSSTSVNLEKKKKISFKKELKILEEKKDQLEAYYNFLKQKDSVESDSMNIYLKAWEDASGGKKTLTEYGLKNVQKLTEKYTTEQIFKAIKIAWDQDIEDDSKRFNYMCGVLKNLKLQEENPEEAKRIYDLRKGYYEVLNYWRKTTGRYYLELKRHIYDKWRKDGIENDMIKEAMDQSGTWAQLRDLINETYYE